MKNKIENKIYYNSYGPRGHTPSYPISKIIKCADDLQNIVVESSYCFAQLKDGWGTGRDGKPVFYHCHKAINEWIASSWLYADVDNVKGIMLSMESVVQKLEGIKFYLTTSKSHQITKDGTPAADRYHLLFPLDRLITDPAEHKLLLKTLHLQVFAGADIDPACIDIVRLFYGNPNAETYSFSGESVESILTLEEFKREEENRKAVHVYNQTKISVDDDEKERLYKFLIVISKMNPEMFDDYQTNLRLAFALKSSGYSLEHALSLVPNEREKQIMHNWNTCNIATSQIGIGTLIFWAKKYGYKPINKMSNESYGANKKA